ncbi:MAG TPA: hypothetical protein EYP85_03565 [Armatimonadetes bacterium]|nr:hypothetical protein [Armatimonadota bacterium]
MLEDLADPKQTLVNLARRGRRRKIREDIVPRPGSSGVVGPGYSARIQEMVATYWDVERAVAFSLSLHRCIARLRELTS